MRLDEDPGVAHFVFVSTENIPEILDLLIHAVEHLPNRVDFDFAAFESLKRETDGQVLCKLHEYRLIRFFARRLRRQSRQGLFQSILRAAR